MKKWYVVSNVSDYLKLDKTIRFETLEECEEECERLRNLNPLMNCFFIPCHEDNGLHLNLTEEEKKKLEESEREAEIRIKELFDSFKK